MNQKLSILNTIYLIRNSHPEMVNIFTNGGCMNFFLILRSIYPQATPWYDNNHVITEIDGKFFDIKGQVLKTDRFDKLVNYWTTDRVSRKISEMQRLENIWTF
jgi:hypothetical protein